MPQRPEQLATLIRHAVQNILARGLNDPRLGGLISITRVEMTEDLSEARVSVSVLPAEHSDLTMKGLHSAAGHIQSQIARAPALGGRRVPRLSFRLDDSLKKAAAVYAAIEQSRPPGLSGDGDQPAAAGSNDIVGSRQPRADSRQQDRSADAGNNHTS
jgi:ribosome-binding factor A